MRPERILVVEDNAVLRRSLVAALTRRAPVVDACGSVAEAREKLTTITPDLLVLDVALPDGNAFDVLDAAQMLDAFPIVLAMSGAAEPDQTFRLAQRGVRAFLPKPIDLASLDRAVDDAIARPPDLVPMVRAAVGHAPVHELEAIVRQTMLNEALGRTHGNKKRAAGLLRISRQLLQHMLRAQGLRSGV